MSAAVVNVALRDDPALPDGERSARGVGRGASVAGVAGGGVAGVAAVGTAGSVAGLSAAGISSGLAAIGGTIGGGMAAGSAIVIAAPAIAAASVGYGACRLTKIAKRERADHEQRHPNQVVAMLRRTTTESAPAKRVRQAAAENEMAKRLCSSAAAVPRRVTQLSLTVPKKHKHPSPPTSDEVSQ